MDKVKEKTRSKKNQKHHALKKRAQDSYDIVVIGAGPAGLSFARALADTGLRIVLLEKQTESDLRNAPYDGRDIALTHLSAHLLQKYGIWDHLPPDDVAKIRSARVLNGTSSYFLGFDATENGHTALGYLVSNHLIRRAAYQSLQEWPNITLMTEVNVIGISTDSAAGCVTLSNGKTLKAPLIVAADSRFSDSRRKMGIPTDMLDFGRVVMVGRMTHQKPHDEIAYECFHDHQTLAVLPLNGHMASIVITTSAADSKKIIAMDEDSFNADITRRFDHRLGKMARVGNLHAYPLVATYARRFYATRYALMGDAAVGMHPVTAHGYNFGLRGADTLATEIRKAQALGLDIGGTHVLRAYDSAHRAATRPLYLGTNLLVDLYTKTDAPARFARKLLLHLGNALPVARGLITARLTELPRKTG